MNSAEQYPYRVSHSPGGAVGLSPYLPLTIVDSGAAINVLPYDLGLQLGAVWEQQTTPVQLTGNLAEAEARGLVVMANVGHFPPVKLVVAWSQARMIPLILGQVNFFMGFDICFFRSRSVFEVKLRS